MAKKQSFGDKILRKKAEVRKMARIVIAERKANGEFRFRSRMVPADAVEKEIQAARA